LNQAYINATALRTICGDTKETLQMVFSRQTQLQTFDTIVPHKTVCIGQMNKELSFETLLFNAVTEVLENSNLDNFNNTLLLVGSSVGGMANSEQIFFQEKSYQNINPQKHIINTIAASLDEEYHFLSSRSYSTACTSSSNALKVAKELINFGAYKNVLVVGADEICKTTIFGFASLGILSDEVSTPFQKNRKGMNVSEGIGVLLLQDKANNSAVKLVGAGTSSDAYHIANPEPNARGAIKAIRNALHDSSLNAAQIDYINAHGTGTQANDSGEAKAIENLFGTSVFVSSSKPNIGHTLGASGAIEAVLCIESLRQQKLLPQIRTDDKEVELNFVTESKIHKLNYILSNSFAFGGNNTALIFGVDDEN
jgi:3-oxoacyl-[acyl-carrier-protein] synthase I